jgi:hypothetical protein
MIEAYVEIGVALATDSDREPLLPAEPRPAGPPAPVRPPRRADRIGRDVRRTLRTVPPDLYRTDHGQTWTTTKVLRRLAWHEPSELITMRALASA